MKFEVEWKSSHYYPDGRRRSRPKASAFHGWLVKWRATFSGNEHLRQEGMREIREAKAMREYKRQQKAAKRNQDWSSEAGTVLNIQFLEDKAKTESWTRQAGSRLTQFSQEQKQPTSGSWENSNQPTTYNAKFTTAII